MSFSINTNVNALKAMDSLNNTQTQMSKSMTRLSTGLRINGAADDPAGLIATKRMSAQIASLGQAQSNTQDAINYAKTADGALDEVNTLLQDARALAVASGNGATLTSDQLAANQQQLQSIVDSVSRIASTTQYGTKKLLDGSAGVQSSVTAGTKLSSLSVGGTFAGAALTSNATVSLTVSTAATQASVTSTTFATSATAVTNTGSFSINGTTFSADANTTAADLVNKINKASDSTGVTASYESSGIVLKSNAYGTSGKIDLVDANGVIRSGGAGASSATGTDAVATMTVGSATALFTGGKNGADGLTLTDADGNSVSLTAAGNATGSIATVGQLSVGTSQFQIGANSGQTAQLSIGNFAASQLGQGAVSGQSLNSMNVTTTSGASDALKIIDKAISDVTGARGKIGNFQKNVLESNARTLSVAKENLTATQSSIGDVDVAEEMTKYTKLQILQSTGMAILSQAKSAPQSVLQLLQG
jgi:flagellin